MKKRILGFILVLTLISMLFIGCSNPSKDTQGETPKEEGTAYEAAFICQSMSNESQAFAAKMIEKHAADYGFNVSIMDAKGDPATEAQLINTAIAQGVDAIIINPNDANGVVPGLMAAKEKGIVVCLFSSDLAEKDQQYRDFYVGANDIEAGKAAAAAFIEQFPDGANIVEIGGQSGHAAQVKRHDGFMEGLKGSNINVLETQNCSAWATNDCLDIMQDFIVKYGDKIDGVFCHWDNGATGVIQALNNANMEIPYLVAVDGCKAGFDQVSAGTQSVSMMQNFETMAAQSLDLCKQVLEGKTVEQINYIKWDTVTKENIDTFTYPEW